MTIFICMQKSPNTLLAWLVFNVSGQIPLDLWDVYQPLKVTRRWPPWETAEVLREALQGWGLKWFPSVPGKNEAINISWLRFELRINIFCCMVVKSPEIWQDSYPTLNRESLECVIRHDHAIPVKLKQVLRPYRRSFIWFWSLGFTLFHQSYLNIFVS